MIPIPSSFQINLEVNEMHKKQHQTMHRYSLVVFFKTIGSGHKVEVLYKSTLVCMGKFQLSVQLMYW